MAAATVGGAEAEETATAAATAAGAWAEAAGKAWAGWPGSPGGPPVGERVLETPAGHLEAASAEAPEAVRVGEGSEEETAEGRAAAGSSAPARARWLSHDAAR